MPSGAVREVEGARHGIYRGARIGRMLLLHEERRGRVGVFLHFRGGGEYGGSLSLVLGSCSSPAAAPTGEAYEEEYAKDWLR